MINLREEEKKIINNITSPIKLDIEGITYYIKEDAYFVELVGEKLASIFGLKCAHYEPLTINGKNYVASKDLNNEGEFRLFENYISGDSLYNLYSIWTTLEENFKDVSKLMHDIVMMYLYDILFMNSDRNFENFGIIENDSEQIVILDNDIFDGEIPPNISSLYGSDDQSSSYADIEVFLKDSSSEFVTEFINIFDSLPPEKFNELLEQVEKDSNVVLMRKVIYQYLYRTNYENIKDIIARFRGEKNAR